MGAVLFVSEVPSTGPLPDRFLTGPSSLSASPEQSHSAFSHPSKGVADSALGHVPDGISALRGAVARSRSGSGGSRDLRSTGSGTIEARPELSVATREVDGHAGATRKRGPSGPSPDALNRRTSSGRPEIQRTVTGAVVAECRYC